jgi:hypothetical protein
MSFQYPRHIAELVQLDFTLLVRKRIGLDHEVLR